ncbi:MAG: hypothetical protein GX307_05700 [Euryarchaeota archaeon]|nr:hypothetical protein [Euryarchaeota archaeon]
MMTPDFSAYAVGVDVHLDCPVAPKEICSAIEDLLGHIARECDRAGATLIGHIKSVVETDGQGFLGVSVIDPTGEATFRGELQEGITQMDIIINVLLYGLTKDRLQGLVDPLVRKYLVFPGGEIELKGLEECHDHDHGGHHNGHECDDHECHSCDHC